MSIEAVLFVGGVVVIDILVLVAAYYLYRLYRLRKRQAEYTQIQEEKAGTQRQQTLNSITILSRGIIAKQVTLTEASIRISALLDALDSPEAAKQDLNVFYQLTEATQHIPILDDWRALSKNDKNRFNSEREQLEEKYRDFVCEAAQRIVSGEVSLIKPITSAVNA